MWSVAKSPRVAKQCDVNTQSINQLEFQVPLTFRRANLIISTYIHKYTDLTQTFRSFRKPWKTLATVDPTGESRGFCRFGLTTRHDILDIYLHRLGVAANNACPICGHARKDGELLLQCTGLAEYPAHDIVSRYWEARRQMFKKPQAGK
ncbi:reverse transcriptase [Trichonephila clavipes]|nr:reverse transcriptase [Trichonephila clavipes]